MKRIHLFELEDLNWFPTFLRNYGTDFLQFISNKLKIYKPIIPLLEKVIKESNTNRIIDLGSGGGGGLIWLNEKLKINNPNLKIVLTDYYPNIPAFKETQKQSTNFDYVPKPIDARNVPKELNGLRTQLLSFHHFKPKEAKNILQNAVDTGNSIAIFETQERSILSFLVILCIPLLVIISTPFIKPFKFGRIIFTYLIPVIPLFVFWDGLVSSFRTYSVKEMNELVNELNAKESFNWEIGKQRAFPVSITYLIGTKK